MSLPPRTKMWLTVSCATELPKLKAITKDMDERLEKVKSDLENAKDEERRWIKLACEEMHPARTSLKAVQDKKKKLEEEIEELQKKTDGPEKLKKVKEELEKVEVEEHEWFNKTSNEIGNERNIPFEMHKKFQGIRDRKCKLKKKVAALQEQSGATKRLKEAKKELEKLKDKERDLKEEAFEEMNSNKCNISDETHKKLEEVREKKKELEEEIDALPKKDDAPNPFVVIAIDDEEDKDTKPMLYTKAVRDTTNPIWKEKFDEFPLEMYLTGKTCYEVFHNSDENYRPQKLVFYIYHDDGVKEKGKEKPKKSDDSWKRDNPQREVLIGKAEWDWFDVCRKVGCADFEKEFVIMHPHTHKKIKDAFLTIKVRLCAPKVRHCSQSCTSQDISRFFVGEEVDELVEAEETTPLVTIKQKKKKSRTSSHGDDCLCSRCVNPGIRRAPPRLRKI